MTRYCKLQSLYARKDDDVEVLIETMFPHLNSAAPRSYMPLTENVEVVLEFLTEGASTILFMWFCKTPQVLLDNIQNIHDTIQELLTIHKMDTGTIYVSKYAAPTPIFLE